MIKHFKGFTFMWPLLQKDNSERKAPEEIKENNSDRIVFYKHPDIFDKLRKAYNYKYMLVSRETTTENSGLFDVTIYPRDERDLAKTRKLIPKGNGLDPKIYGGYSGNSSAYMVIVKIEQAKNLFIKLLVFRCALLQV
ncbi:Cas9 endonuclease PAM-interacting domain-containing protein [Lactobacillus sp. R2/2]|nr:Cas9 endonuclease PAM-interacting domain-containing protein [Lactobacillus sp. R2/2]